jgi:hypothetical protein
MRIEWTFKIVADPGSDITEGSLSGAVDSKSPVSLGSKEASLAGRVVVSQIDEALSPLLGVEPIDLETLRVIKEEIAKRNKS